MLRMLLAVTLVGLLCASIQADEPQKKQDAEPIPAPKMRVETLVIGMPAYQRTDTRDVWQHYDVNSMGRFVPRVLVLPYGSYYSRNLEPYPWTPNRPTAVLPRIVD